MLLLQLLEELYKVIEDRINNPKEGSYTSKIALDENNIKEKIREEAGEVIDYRDNLIWEIADLTYFVMVLMAKRNISITEVKNELLGRRK
ncbi:MAG: phosphoribosyl-ATP diphosphatase [Nanoarchaeota archaeon]|nr:phosphoribosyl-ATP diphosphatase [Nanoarchaeota archaeon]